MGTGAWDFRDKVVLVTGGSDGIGSVTARMFAESGADVAIAARRQDKLEARALAIQEASGRRCLAVPADATDSAQVATMVERTLAEFGRIDILINNAGGSVRSPLKRLTPEVWERGRALNLDSVAYCTMAVGQHFLERKSGVIVNISSVAGLSGVMGESTYAASKAGVQMFTRVSAAEWGPHGVRINCVAPGMTETENMKARIASGVYDVQEICSRFPLRRPGRCEEVGHAILFLASDYASYITGQTLAVDGGPAIGGFTE